MTDILKFSNAGGFTTKTRYPDMLAGNTVWNPYSPTGSYDSLASVTVGSTNPASITFSGIPQTYTHLQLRIQARGTGSGGYYTSVPITLNGDTTTGNYYNHTFGGNGASTVNPSPSSGYATNSLINIPNSANTANAFAAGIIDILDYTSTTKNKTLRSLTGADLNSSAGFPYSGAIFLSSMLWSKTPEAITSITFTADPTYSTIFATGSSFALYGVKA